MTPERWQQIEKLYHQALEQMSVERPSFLKQACDGDADLRREVESLLAQDTSNNGMLDRPAFEGAQSLLEPAGAQLIPGTQLGPYKIEALVGKGGMGEVYRARDTTLKRDVAVKVLPAAFASDRERVARFKREAEVLALLNHPGIASIYGVEDRALIIELVLGPTLADRIARGPIPVGETLDILLQIAEALEYAHDKGVIHRDLKPANIKIDPRDKVKILDFGLAKALADPIAGVPDDPANSPTVTMGGATAAGIILGTAAYMAPEQARGKKIDKRADIWAFGVVVWEMLTGERLFKGESTAEVLGKVLEQKVDLDWIPEKFRKLLSRCLDRNVKDRLRDMGEVRFLMEDSGNPTQPILKSPARLRWLWPALAAIFALTALAVGYAQYRRSIKEPFPVERLSMLTPERVSFNNAGSIPAISPDGRQVAFAPLSGGQSVLWLRELDGINARMLPGTSGAAYPFWSPDGRSVGFFAEGKLKKIDVTGGPVRTLCDVTAGRGGAWSQDDIIVYGIQQAGLFRVPAAGGTPPVALTEPDRAAGERDHRAPWFLPDGQHFLYTARSLVDATKTRVYVDGIDAKPGSKNRREVLVADTNAVYVPPALSALGFSEKGYLLFVRERTLMAQPFDPAKAQTTGAVVPIAEQVDYFPVFSQSQFSASRNGTLVYTSGALGDQKKQLTWFDRGGKSKDTVGMPADIEWAWLSPDGSAVATDPMDTSGARDIWRLDLTRGTPSRLTFGPSFNRWPVWSPDGSRIAFTLQRGGNSDPYVKAANGVGLEEVLDRNPRPNRALDWSHDGRYLIEGVTDPQTGNDIWIIPQFGDKKPFAYLHTEFAENNAKLSPNDQWLAYSSNESKRNEVYVETFPERGGRWPISTKGGDFPVWSRDGRELYFIGADRKLMAVEVKGNGKRFQPGVAKPLFEVAAHRQFDVSKDGRFLIQVPIEQSSASVPLTIVTNWQAGLKK
jgi:serine/threonine protein kinase/Tol biopolymer transport system component